MTSEDYKRSMTSKYQNIHVWRHWLMVNIFMMYKSCHKNVFIFHRALVIIYRCLTLTPKDSERSITSKYQILMWWLVLTELLFEQDISTAKSVTPLPSVYTSVPPAAMKTQHFTAPAV